MIKWLLLGFVFLNVSCSKYFTRKSCEKVNWFQHAYNIAMDGKRLEEDTRFKECEKAETEMNAAEIDRGFKAGMENYCKPETAYAKGVAGAVSLNYDFCETNLGPRMRTRYMEGLRKFCQPDSAYTFASKGGSYAGQCPKEMEAALMVKFRKGRHVFLKNQIASNEAQIKGLETEIRDQNEQRRALGFRIAALPRTKVVSKTKSYDPVTKSYKEDSVVTEDPNIQRQRESLGRQIEDINYKIQTKRDSQRLLQDQIHQFRSEMESLK